MPTRPTEHAFTLILITILALVCLSFFGGTAEPQAVCTHYSAPNGSGNACSQSQPCKVQSFWAHAGPGKVLCLADGLYRGSDSMILPPAGLKGTPAQPLTIRAEHDGQVLLDAQHQGFAVWIGWHGGPATENAWFIVEGVNATNGLEATYNISGSDTVLKRVIGWNGTTGQDDSNMFKITGYRSRAEDCAGWGMNVRKIFDGAQSGNLQGAGFRRCWGEWNDHPQGGSNPNNTFELGYNSSGQLYENVIGTWDTKGQTAEVEGVMHMFGSNDPNKPHDMQGSKLLGSIFYAAPGQQFAPSSLVETYGLSGMTVEEVVAIASPAQPQVKPFAFLSYLCTSTRPCTDNVCRNCLAVHAGMPSYIEANSGWGLPGFRQGNGLQAATGGQSAFDLLPGLCTRYEHGTRTTTPLWPWPMNQRIKDARVASGFASVDVTAQIEALLGPIPAACRLGTAPEPPEPPIPPAHATPLSCVGLQGEGGGIAIACHPHPATR